MSTYIRPLQYGTSYKTEPITTSYASLQTSYTPKNWKISSSVIIKNVSQYWYRQPSEIEGVVVGASIMRIFTRGENVLLLQLDARKRWLYLKVNGQQIIPMPGPAPLQAGFRTEFGTNRFGLLVDTQLHFGRRQDLSEELVTSLGDLFLLNVGFTTRFGPLNLGLTVGNALGKIYDNKLLAYQRRINGYEREIDYIKAPFIPGISRD